MTIGITCFLNRIRAVVSLLQDCKRIHFINIFFWFAFLCAGLISGCVPADCSDEIRFIHDRATATGYEILEIDKCVFGGAAAEEVMITLEIGRRNGGIIALLDKPPNWRIVDPAENNLSILGTMRISFEKSENCDVVRVSVFVRGELASRKVLNIRK
jgi:hypothetical protein